ncbi:hypothetical protein BDZ91DRAFT_714080 [Kalaharituber pfeilii]|nr:hypothetical protein BDZ91DRAFT_714080 [Kalaharituber pfeilii]
MYSTVHRYLLCTRLRVAYRPHNLRTLDANLAQASAGGRIWERVGRGRRTSGCWTSASASIAHAGEKETSASERGRPHLRSTRSHSSGAHSAILLSGQTARQLDSQTARQPDSQTARKRDSPTVFALRSSVSPSVFAAVPRTLP